MKPRLPRLLLALAAIAVALLLASLAFADGAGGGLAALAPALPSPTPVPHVAVSPEATAALWTAGLAFASTLCGAIAPLLAGSWPKLASLLHGLGVTLHMWRSARGAVGGDMPMTLVYAGAAANAARGVPLSAPVPTSAATTDVTPSGIGSAGLIPVILLVGLALGTARVLAACGPLSPGAASAVSRFVDGLVCGVPGQSIEDVLCRKLAADPAECAGIAVDYVIGCDAVAAAVPMVPVSTPAGLHAKPARESALRAAIERLPGVARKNAVDGGDAGK